MPDYNDLPLDRHQRARSQLSIPDWFDDFRIESEWVNYEDTVTIDDSEPLVRILKRYGHQNGKCYQINELSVHGWQETTRRGTVLWKYFVDSRRVREATRNAQVLLLRRTAEDLGDYADPSLQTAGGLLDLTIAFRGLPLPQIFGSLGQAISLGQLLDNISEIAEKIERVLRDLERMSRANSTIIARFDNVVWAYNWEPLKTASSIDIIEIVCAAWILKIPEGETIRVPENDEWLTPLSPLDAELERELEEIRQLEETSDLTKSARSTVRKIVETYGNKGKNEPKKKAAVKPKKRKPAAKRATPKKTTRKKR